MERLLLGGVCCLALGAGCSRTAETPADRSGIEAAPVAGAAAARPSDTIDHQAAAAGEWPNWRGPGHDGISLERGWRTDWSREGPPVAWTAEVGTGFSSMSVAGGRLYTMGHAGDDDTVWCFDAGTGSQLWKHSYPCALVDNLHEGGPAATPTVNDGRVFSLSKEGHLFALAADSGEVLWNQELQALVDVEMPEWGFSSSPLVLGELLVIDAGRLVALDKTSGELVWQTAEFRAGYGSAVPFELRGEQLIAVLNNDCLLVVRAADGSEVASHRWQTQYATSATTPIVSGDTFFISTGYQRGCALLRLVGDELEVVYENDEMSNHMNNCVLWEGHLYGFDGNSNNRRLVQLACLDHSTGAVRWQERGLGCGSLMIADGKLIVLGDDGGLVIAGASPEEFRELARARVLSGKCWTVPVLAQGRIYCRNAAGRLVALDVRESREARAESRNRGEPE